MKPTSSKRATLTLQSVQDSSSPPVYRRGVQYYRRKKVLKYEESNEGTTLQALVIGSEPQPYKVVANVLAPDKFKAECSCPYFEEVCKHSVAVLLTHVARSFPGIKFDVAEDARRDNGDQQASLRAKDVLEDPNIMMSELSKPTASNNDITLGCLILEKPLALIIGTLPPVVQGKVNILKIPGAIADTLPPGSRIQNLVKYLTALPQATKGIAGGHRIPRGEEGLVLGHVALCAKFRRATDGEEITFSKEAAKPKFVISETENGELSIRLKAMGADGKELEDVLFFMGQPSWILCDKKIIPIDLAAIHRLFQFFDARGNMTVKLEAVPKFLAVDLPILKKRMEVELDETSAPFPVAITEPPKVVIRLSEKKTTRAGGAAPAVNIMPEMELVLGFAYGSLVLPSRDETSAVESELYTRTISDTGQSVWVKRLWNDEGQLRKLLGNMHPTRMIADRFFFHEEPALDVLFYLRSEQCSEWEISGWDQLKVYRVQPHVVQVKAILSLNKDDYKFSFELKASTSSGTPVAFNQVIEAVVRNRGYIKLEDTEYVKLPVTTLMSLTKQIGQAKDMVRPLYQALPIAAILEQHGIEIESDEGFREFIHKLRNFKEMEHLNVPDSFVGTLREYQREGFQWLAFMRDYGLAGILADDMGLGKTIQALTLLLYHHKNGKKREPSLVVAPTSVVYNWQAEAKKFAPKLRTEMFLGRDRDDLLKKLKKDKDKDKPDVFFTTYGIIRRDWEKLKEHQFDFVILDEAQNIKNPESVGAKATKSLKAVHRLCLSGTPIENRLKELWSLFDFLMPDFLGTSRDFNDNFERPIEAGHSDAGQKLRKIVHPFILRRLKSQVEQELPERTDIINICEMEDEQRSLYLDVLDECRQKVFGEIAQRGIGRSQISVLAALLRLRQVCCDPRLLKNMEGTPPPSAKLSGLLEMIEEIVDSGHRILVFSQFVEMLTLIRAEFEKSKIVYEYIDGQTPAKDRLEKVNRFNADESIPVFLISLKAGGTGLNLTGADYVIHYDPWWNPAVENQATDRAHRIGQTKHVFNYKLITRGSVEEKILELQKKKKELADMVIGGDESVAKQLTREDLEYLLGAEDLREFSQR